MKHGVVFTGSTGRYSNNHQNAHAGSILPAATSVRPEQAIGRGLHSLQRIARDSVRRVLPRGTLPSYDRLNPRQHRTIGFLPFGKRLTFLYKRYEHCNNRLNNATIR